MAHRSAHKNSSRVVYKDKSGRLTSSTFPTRAMAESYAKTVLGARIEEVEMAPARLDAERTARGRTRIVGHHRVGERVGPHI